MISWLRRNYRTAKQAPTSYAPMHVSNSNPYGDIIQVQSPGPVNIAEAIHINHSHELLRAHQNRWNFANRLSTIIRERENEDRVLLLADSSVAFAADLAFRRTKPEVEQVREDAGADIGTLSGIADYYQSLEKHRLVLLGEPGAGKTVLGMQLLLDILGSQHAAPHDKPLMVPVRLNLSSFDDPRISLAGIPTAEITRLLSQWMVQEISTSYSVRRRKVQDLLREGWFLPIFDGLDEMDLEGEFPRRALAVVRTLNDAAHHGTKTVVLTCRKSFYSALAAIDPREIQGARTGEIPVLQFATAVELQPLAASVVRRHIARRFGGSPGPVVPSDVSPRWRPVLAHLDEQPNSPFSMLLRRPLWLFVTIAAYMCHGNPADLIELDGDTVQNHLLARLIPETIAQHQPQKGKPWSTTETHQYLKAIAGLLARRRTQNQGSFTGVRVHELWQLAGRRLPKAFTATLNGSLVTLLMLMGLAWYHEKTSYWIPPHAAGDILIIAGLTYAVWVFIASYRTPGYLRSLDFLTLMAKNNRQRLLLAFLLPLAGLVVGLFYGLWFSQEYGDRIGYSYGISWTILFFVLSAEILLGQLPEAVRRPSSIMRRALTFQSAMIATYGLSFAAAHGVANKFAYPSHPTAFTDGAVLGLCIGLAIGVGRTYRAPGTRHLIAITFLTVTGTLPRRRMGKFLDWAYTAGILRFVGISVQFRHQAVQH